MKKHEAVTVTAPASCFLRCTKMPAFCSADVGKPQNGRKRWTDPFGKKEYDAYTAEEFEAAA